jgi:preprotein translocase subunit SecG
VAGHRPAHGRARRDRAGTLTPVLTSILSGLQVILGVGLMVLVLMHSGKDTGLSGMFNPAGGSYGGTAVMERNLTRLTVVVAILFTANVIALGFLL